MTDFKDIKEIVFRLKDLRKLSKQKKTSRKTALSSKNLAKILL